MRDLLFENRGRTQRVVATPTYFVNGVRVVGARSFNDFRLIVEAIERGAGPKNPEATGDAGSSR